MTNFEKNKFYNKKIFLIAEVGVNHNGDLKKALKLINHASKAGFDAVKFQTFDLETMLLPNTKLAIYQKKTNFSNMKEMLKKYSLSKKKFIKIKNYCKKKKIIFLSTPFDINSAKFLNKLNVPLFKISSGDLDNFLLLREIKSYKKPMIISTGMSNLIDVKKSLNFLKLNKNKLTIMHCISEYPTKLKDSQLGIIKELKKFNYQVGLSDHTQGFEASIASCALGVNVIEKHITLNNNFSGPDHKSSMHVKYLDNFVKTIRSISASLQVNKRFKTKEESRTLKVARKGLYYQKNLKKNHILNVNDLIALRPLGNGLSPSSYYSLIGKKLKKNIKKFQMIKKSDFI